MASPARDEEESGSISGKSQREGCSDGFASQRVRKRVQVADKTIYTIICGARCNTKTECPYSKLLITSRQMERVRLILYRDLDVRGQAEVEMGRGDRKEGKEGKEVGKRGEEGESRALGVEFLGFLWGWRREAPGCDPRGGKGTGSVPEMDLGQ